MAVTEATQKDWEDFWESPDDIPFYTVEQWQADFDNLFARVENGETIGITDGNLRAVMVPIGDELAQQIHVDTE